MRAGETPVELPDALGAEIARLNRPHWYRHDAGSVARKTLVRLAADKTTFAADGADGATVTHDADGSVLLDINGVEQAAAAGLLVKSPMPGQFKVQVSPNDPAFYTDDAAGTADGGPLLLIAEVPDGE